MPGEKTPCEEQRSSNPYPYLSLNMRIKSGPRSWEAIALTTAPPQVLLRPYFGLNVVFNFAHDSGLEIHRAIKTLFRFNAAYFLLNLIAIMN